MHLRYVGNDLNQHFMPNFINRSLTTFILSSGKKKRPDSNHKLIFCILKHVLKGVYDLNSRGIAYFSCI